MKSLVAALALALLSIYGAPSLGYPLNGFETMGIRRLGVDRILQEEGKNRRLGPGALLGIEDISLHLTSNPNWDPTDSAPDPVLSAALSSIFESRDPSYAFSVIDITDPEKPVWAGLRDSKSQFPGSVGKVISMAALFDALARAFPDLADRERVLRETMVVADEWAMGDNFHKVPHPDPDTGRNLYRPIQMGDRFSLAEWIDHMISASANSAGATVWKQAMLLRHFGASYPPTKEAELAFFKDTPKGELQRLSQEVNNQPLVAAGIDVTNIQQGTFWTKPAQARVPGMRSFASPRELVRLLLRIEQGRLVDEWSCVEMKRYLYMTRSRYRYVYAPELRNSAVYFKSGSFYRCREEEGFRCGKYKGNKENLMNSIAIIESPAARGEGQRVYIVALISDVLKVNSAWDHSRLGAAIDEAVRTRKPTVVREDGSEEDVNKAGG